LLALFNGTNWFMNTLLGGISLLISSLLMLRCNLYSRATAYVGIFTNAVVCGFFLYLLQEQCCCSSLSQGTLSGTSSWQGDFSKWRGAIEVLDGW
jgi:hypothetical protein